MANIVGGVATTHVPSIGKAIAENKQNDPYWKPFFSGFDFVHRWLAEVKPDVAVVFYNDHGLNFFLDKMPTFAIGAAKEYRNEDEGWGIPVSQAVVGDPALSWHLVNALVADEFDMTVCQEMLVDHAVTIPLALMWPAAARSGQWPVKIVPVEINTVQHPLPSVARCLDLGRSIGRALESYPDDLRVVVVGTGGLSHQLDGERAGFINQDFDKLCMDALGKGAGCDSALFDPRTGRACGRARRRIAELDGHARRAHGSGDRSAPQLPHPGLQHRRRDHGVREQAEGASAGGLNPPTRLYRHAVRGHPPHSAAGSPALWLGR